mgnify:CR=1 FL=1
MQISCSQTSNSGATQPLSQQEIITAFFDRIKAENLAYAAKAPKQSLDFLYDDAVEESGVEAD